MRSPRRPLAVGFVILLFTLVGGASQPRASVTVSPTIVISQVYGGGGNVGAPFTNDYIEIFNRSSNLVDVSGWSLQYTSATGTGNFGSASNLITPLSAAGLIAPGQYVLVQEASG